MVASQPKLHKETPLSGTASGQAGLAPAEQVSILDFTNQREGHLPLSGAVFPGINRLVVLIPDLDAEEARLSRYIWSLAVPQQLEVLLVSLVQAPGDEFHAVRRLTSMASITRDAWVKVDTQVLFGRSWAKAIKPILQAGDLLVCPADQCVNARWGKKVSLDAALQDTLRKPVHLIPSFFQEEPPSRLSWIRRLPFWIGMLIILVSFSLLEMDVSRSITDWTGQVILIGLILVETGLLYWWTSITS